MHQSRESAGTGHVTLDTALSGARVSHILRVPEKGVTCCKCVCECMKVCQKCVSCFGVLTDILRHASVSAFSVYFGASTFPLNVPSWEEESNEPLAVPPAAALTASKCPLSVAMGRAGSWRSHNLRLDEGDGERSGEGGSTGGGEKECSKGNEEGREGGRKGAEGGHGREGMEIEGV